jgi:glycosyltransferase 2 family protein
MASVGVRRAATRVRAVMRSTVFRRIARPVVGGGVLIAVVAHVGAGPFVHGLLSLNVRSIVAATLLCAIATVAAAWRWWLIAGRLGAHLRISDSIGMYYRSQFLNTVLPGGVAGDVHRAVSHGRSTDQIGAASRAVVIERSAGQVVQFAMGLAVLAIAGARLGSYLIVPLVVGAGALCAVVVLAVAVSKRLRRLLRHELNELRVGVGSPAVASQVALASIIVVGCHVATFAVATQALGEEIPPGQLLTLALVVLLGASIPLNVGGWGPREGIAGWSFALAGFGASAGVAASTLYGVLAFIAVAAGAIVSATVAALRRRAQGPAPAATTPQDPAQPGAQPPQSQHPSSAPERQPISVLTPQHREETP